MRIWCRENKNKFVIWKALDDTVGIKNADLEENFVLVFCSFPYCLNVGEWCYPRHELADEMIVLSLKDLLSSRSRTHRAWKEENAFNFQQTAKLSTRWGSSLWAISFLRWAMLIHLTTSYSDWNTCKVVIPGLSKKRIFKINLNYFDQLLMIRKLLGFILKNKDTFLSLDNVL